jgi:hypothetical protein
LTATDGDSLVAIKCKRIIDGKTYNTETATQIAGSTNYCGQFDSGQYLYQTRFGAFFEYSYLYGSNDDDYDDIKPLTPEEARAWLEKNHGGDPDLIEKVFGQMPEAGSGEVKYTLRMPETLRDRLAALAKANDQSLNAWIVRCLESSASNSSVKLDHPMIAAKLRKADELLAQGKQLSEVLSALGISRFTYSWLRAHEPNKGEMFKADVKSVEMKPVKLATMSREPNKARFEVDVISVEMKPGKSSQGTVEKKPVKSSRTI